MHPVPLPPPNALPMIKLIGSCVDYTTELLFHHKIYASVFENIQRFPSGLSESISVSAALPSLTLHSLGNRSAWMSGSPGIGL